MQVEDDLNALPTELELVGGLLRWIVRRDPSWEGYFTRSGLVARVSVYLRSIGYALGSVKIWNGVDPKPCFAQGVILVTGGTESTDELKLDPGDIVDSGGRTFYYRHATVGAMLVNATLPFGTDIAPETAQEYFRSAEQVVTRVIQPRRRATAKNKKGIEVVLASHGQWRSKKSQASAHAPALASICFPLSAHLLAQCYETIATDSIRRCVIQNKSNFGVFDGLPQDLITFRVVTAGIIIAIVATLGGPEYWEISHASSIDLTSEDPLEYMAKLIDKGLSSSMPMAEAVSLLAAIHCAVHSHALFSERLKVDDKIIGARVGIFSVVPSLFLNMTPGPESVGLVCVDKFIGNVPVHPDGWIKSGTTAGILWRETETFPTTGVEIARRGYPFDPSTGAPAIAPPDIPLYISIERPRHYAGPDVMLTGRVNGEVVGSVGIDDVLYVVLAGMEAAVKCPGTCPGVHNVRNIPASEWMKGPIRDPSYPICLQVDDDSTWRLLAAGQVAQGGGVLMYGCFHCALEGHLDYGGTGAGRKASVVVAGHERIGDWRDENRMV